MDEADVCVLCGDDGGEEKLSKCHAIGFRTLQTHAKGLGRRDLEAKIDERWKAENLLIHKSCRITLKNSWRDYKKSGMFSHHNQLFDYFRFSITTVLVRCL